MSTFDREDAGPPPQAGQEEYDYRVGQRILHPQFGVGLIVDVRRGRGPEVIEVVFGTELKRLSARVRWQPADAAGRPAEPAPGAPEGVAAGETGDGGQIGRAHV